MILFYFKPAYFPQKVQLVHMLQVMLKLHIPSLLEGFRGITLGTKKKSWGSLHMPPVAFQTIKIFT